MDCRLQPIEVLGKWRFADCNGAPRPRAAKCLGPHPTLGLSEITLARVSCQQPLHQGRRLTALPPPQNFFPKPDILCSGHTCTCLHNALDLCISSVILTLVARSTHLVLSGCFLDSVRLHYPSSCERFIGSTSRFHSIPQSVHPSLPRTQTRHRLISSVPFATCLSGSISFGHIYAQSSTQSILVLNLGTERKEPGPRRRPTPSLLTTHSNMSVIQLEEYGSLSICITAPH